MESTSSQSLSHTEQVRAIQSTAYSNIEDYLNTPIYRLLYERREVCRRILKEEGEIPYKSALETLKYLNEQLKKVLNII